MSHYRGVQGRCERDLRSFVPTPTGAAGVAAAPVRRLMLHPGADVAVFRCDQAGVRHFGFYLHWLKSRLLCTPGKKGERILVLQSVAHILQVRSNVHGRTEGEVVGLSAGLLSQEIQARLREIRAEQTTAGAAYSRRIN